VSTIPSQAESRTKITGHSEVPLIHPQEKLQKTLATVTVMVPVYNEEAYIGHTLDQLLEQLRSGIELEILVVDGQSTDNTREIVSQYAIKHREIQLLDNPQRLASAARNVAIQQSTGQYILLVDGHCEIPSNRYFIDLVDAFERSGADCLGRPQPLNVSHATKLQQAIAQARSSWLGHHPKSYIYSSQEVDCPATSVAIAYRRSVFEKVGYFDERFDACEDCDMNHRIDKASLKCRLIPNLTMKYHPRNSLRGLFRQLYRYGRGRVRLMRKHPDSFQIITKLPAIMFAIIAGLFVSWAMPFLLTFYFAAMVVYVMVVFATSIWESIKKRDSRLLLWLPVVFVTIHAGAGTGIFIETFAEWGQKP